LGDIICCFVGNIWIALGLAEYCWTALKRRATTNCMDWVGNTSARHPCLETGLHRKETDSHFALRVSKFLSGPGQGVSRFGAPQCGFYGLVLVLALGHSLKQTRTVVCLKKACNTDVARLQRSRRSRWQFNKKNPVGEMSKQKSHW
jgi:hypothetical protein